MKTEIGAIMLNDFNPQSLVEIRDAAKRRAEWLQSYAESSQDKEESEKLREDANKFANLAKSISKLSE